MPKKKINSELITNILVLLIGLAGGSFTDALMKNLIPTEIRYVVIVSVLGSLVLVIGVISILKTFKRVEEDIETISDRIYPTLELLPYTGLRTPFSVVIDLLKNAKEIVILDYFPWGGEINQEQDAPNADFVKYYNALNEFIDRGGKYKRLVQIPDGASHVLREQDISDPIAIAHMKKVVAMSKNLGSNVIVKTCQVFVQQVSFLIIDECYVSWEIPTIDTNNKFNFGQDFYIEDPKKKITKELMLMLDQVDNQSFKVQEIS